MSSFVEAKFVSKSWGAPKGGGSGWTGFLGNLEPPVRDTITPEDEIVYPLRLDLNIWTEATECSDCDSYSSSPLLCVKLPHGSACSSEAIFNIYSGPQETQTLTPTDGPSPIELVGVSNDSTYQGQDFTGNSDRLKLEVQALSGPLCYPSVSKLTVLAHLQNESEETCEIKKARVDLYQDGVFVTFFDLLFENKLVLSPEVGETEIPLFLEELPFDPSRSYGILVYFYDVFDRLLNDEVEPWNVPLAPCGGDMCLFLGDEDPIKIYPDFPTFFDVTLEDKLALPEVKHVQTTGECPSSDSTSLSTNIFPLELVPVAIGDISYDITASGRTLTLTLDGGKVLSYDKTFTVNDVVSSSDEGIEYLGDLTIPAGSSSGTFTLDIGVSNPTALQIIPQRALIE